MGPSVEGETVSGMLVELGGDDASGVPEGQRDGLNDSSVVFVTIVGFELELGLEDEVGLGVGFHFVLGCGDIVGTNDADGSL